MNSEEMAKCICLCSGRSGTCAGSQASCVRSPMMHRIFDSIPMLVQVESFKHLIVWIPKSPKTKISAQGLVKIVYFFRQKVTEALGLGKLMV